MHVKKLKCKICEYEAKQLHQHLKSIHGLNALQYRKIYGESEIMQIGFSPKLSTTDPLISDQVRSTYKRMQAKLESMPLYTKEELKSILSTNDLWHKYIGKTKYRTMICDDPILYKSIMHYTLQFDTTLENRMKYIVKFNFDISKCYCKCKHRLTFGKLYCRKCPEFKRNKILEKLKTHLPGNGAYYNKKSIPVIESIAIQYGIDDIIHAENGGEYRICGYAVDGYSPSKNIVIEYDEKHHFLGNLLRERDIIRQDNIKKEIGCKFIRINYKNEVYHAE